MPYSEPGAVRVLNSSTYVSQPLAFATSRQPNLTRPTQVISTVRISLNALNEEGTVTFEVSPDNAAWTVIATSRARVNSVGNDVPDNAYDSTVTAVVPPGWYYRRVTATVTATPTFTAVSNFEMTL